MESRLLMWADMPLDPLAKSLSYLDDRDLCHCSLVCRYWNDVAKEDLIWKSKFSEVWLPTGENIEELRSASRVTTYKELFRQYQQEWGRYREVYARTKSTWNSIEKQIQTKALNIYSSLRAGVTEEDLNRFEGVCGVKLPDDMRCSYRIRNGQNAYKASPVVGLFGGYSFYNHVINMQMYPLDKLLIFQKKQLPFTWAENCLPIAQSFNSLKFWFLVVKDAGDFKRGQIIEICRSTECAFLVAENLISLLSELASSLESGDYEVSSTSGIIRYNSKSPFVATTRGVCVQASPLFVSEQSDPQNSQFFFAYRIRMSMADHMSDMDKCKLESRRWVIKRKRGEEPEIVSGPGVIGLYPEMKPGANFEYASCSPVASPTDASMEGTFQMRSASNGNLFDVVVPEFLFRAPKILRM